MWGWTGARWICPRQKIYGHIYLGFHYVFQGGHFQWDVPPYLSSLLLIFQIQTAYTETHPAPSGRETLASQADLERYFTVNSLTPGKFEWNFRHVIFKQILVIDGWGISCEIALIWMSLDFTDDQSTLIQVMAWCCQTPSHYLSQCWLRSLSPYDFTKPQWVNSLGPGRCGWNFELAVFKLISRIDILSISCKITHRWVPQDLIDY